MRKNRLTWFGHTHNRSIDESLELINFEDTSIFARREKAKKMWIETIRNSIKKLNLTNKITFD